MGINSRRKGNKNERIAAALFTTWTKRKFERTPSSGGLQWKGSFAKGDIVCTVDRHYCPFCVEIKAHKEIDFSHLMIPGIKNVKIFEFWKQCRRDARKAKKLPLLLMRYDRLPKAFFFTAMPLDFWFAVKHLFPNVKYLHFQDFINPAFAVISSIDFFKVDYKTIRRLTKTYLRNGKKEKA